MTPFVTIIVPTLNRKEWLIEAVESLRAQDYPHDRFEVIAVDNGSRDGAWEWLLATALLPGPRLRCFRNETIYKVSSGSRNVGIRHAAGEIVGFTDSDCIASADWIRKGVGAFREGVDIVVGRTIPPPGDRPTPLSKIKIVDSEGFFDTCNIFYTREVIDRAGGFDTDVLATSGRRRGAYGEDSELGIRVKAMGYGSVFVADAVVQHRVRDQTLWQWLIEPLPLYSCPYLVKKHPQIRRDFMFLRYFLTPMTALFDLLLVGVVLALAVNPWCAVLCVPFLTLKFSEAASHVNPALRVVRVAGGSLRAFFIFGVLVSGSIRFRRLLI
ncbi:MAG: glycosyltransferase [Acidobacteriota bacterium]|nr:glycosyltransferase [Acidobacteriota bacterium]